MEYAAYSHMGLVRKCNEDYYYKPDNECCMNIMVVADGMGGHNAGDLASRLAVEHICAYFRKHCSQLTSSDEVKCAINESIQYANHEVYNLSKTHKTLYGMGTTLTMSVVFMDRVYIGHVGDSRAYLICGNSARQLTKDHSLVQELLDNGSITHDEMLQHPQKNVITRALGTEEKIRVDCCEEEISEGDIIFLCTDGLIRYIDMEEYVKQMSMDLSLKNIVEILGNKALTAGGTDNITVVASRYSSNKEMR